MIDIQSVAIINGHLPKKIFTIIKKWAILNQSGLWENWSSIKAKGEYNKIKPL